MQAEFKGFELDTPLGAVSIGQGYSTVAGSDFFRGLAIRLPMGTIRVGWRVWTEQEEPPETPPSHFFARHLLVAGFVWITAIILNWSLGLSGGYLKWLIPIWGAVLALQLLQAPLMSAADCLAGRISGCLEASAAGLKRQR